MKKVLLFAIIAMIAAVGWSGPLTLTVMTNGVQAFSEWEGFRGYAGVREKIAAEFGEKYGTKVVVLYRNQATGSMDVEALMAAGTPPDVWIDASGYFFGKYLNEEYAIPFQKYLDLSVFQKALLDIYTVAGNVYALPFSNVGGGFAVNKDMLDAVGYTLPEIGKWTTDEFLSLGAKLKAKGWPATMIMGKGGLNSWTKFWLYAFGAEDYKGGNLSKTAINSPETIKGLAYIKKLVDNGFAFGNPIEVNDDDAVEFFTIGKVFSSVMQNGHTDGWIPEQVRLGKIKAPINVRFTEVPHAAGREHTPVYGYQTVVVAHKQEDAQKNALVAKLAYALVSHEAQFYNTLLAGGFSTLNNWQPKLGTAASQTYQDVAGLMVTAGLLPIYQLGNKDAEVKKIWNTLSEQWFRGKLTAQAFLNQYEAEANKVLAR